MATSPATQQLFQISVPPENRTLELDVNGRGVVTYTVHNVTAREVVGRALLPSGDPLVRDGHVAVSGAADKTFQPNQDQQYTIKIDLGPKKMQLTQGTVTVRFVDSRFTDIGDDAPHVTWKMPAQGEHRKVNWKLIAIICAVVVVIAIGGAAYFFMPAATTTVPNLSRLEVAQATDVLKQSKLKLGGQTFEHSDEDVNKVLRQDPAPEAKVKQGAAVAVTVGTANFPLPDVTLKSEADARAALQPLKVALTVSHELSTAVTKGFVTRQNPAPQSDTAPGTPVEIWIADKPVVVPQVIVLPIDAAVGLLNQAGLKPVLTGLCQAQPRVMVIAGRGAVQLQAVAQDPPPSKTVAEGTQVTLNCTFM